MAKKATKTKVEKGKPKRTQKRTSAVESKNKDADKKIAPVEDIIVRSSWKNAPSTPQKARLVADLIRGKPALEALDILSLTQKKAAVLIRKVVRSAIANAEHNHNVNKESLMVSRILVDDGIKFRRFRAVSRGRAHGFVRRRCNILVELKGTK